MFDFSEFRNMANISHSRLSHVNESDPEKWIFLWNLKEYHVTPTGEFANKVCCFLLLF